MLEFSSGLIRLLHYRKCILGVFSLVSRTVGMRSTHDPLAVGINAIIVRKAYQFIFIEFTSLFNGILLCQSRYVMNVEWNCSGG